MSEKIKAMYGDDKRADEVRQWLEGKIKRKVEMCPCDNDKVYFINNNEEVDSFPVCYAYLFDIVMLPKRELRPYNSMQEFFEAEKNHGPWIKLKDGGSCYKAMRINDSLVYLLGVAEPISYNYERLLERFEWQDGTPCGVLKGGKE